MFSSTHSTWLSGFKTTPTFFVAHRCLHPEILPSGSVTVFLPLLPPSLNASDLRCPPGIWRWPALTVLHTLQEEPSPLLTSGPELEDELPTQAQGRDLSSQAGDSARRRPHRASSLRKLATIEPDERALAHVKVLGETCALTGDYRESCGEPIGSQGPSHLGLRRTTLAQVWGPGGWRPAHLSARCPACPGPAPGSARDAGLTSG